MIITDRPTTNDESKNICPKFHCDFGCKIVKDENDCSICDCQTFEQPTTDAVAIDEAGKKICPEVKCDLHCERGLVMDENDCTFCKCRTPESTSCPPLIGCRKRCAFGYKTNKRGCSVSRIEQFPPFFNLNSYRNILQTSIEAIMLKHYFRYILKIRILRIQSKND